MAKTPEQKAAEAASKEAAKAADLVTELATLNIVATADEGSEALAAKLKLAKQAAKDAEKAAAANAAEVAKAEAAAKVAAGSDIPEGLEVGDPVLLRPVSLPLVVKPAKGTDWKNDEQRQYAGYLNGYAYKNPKKWAKKRAVLLKRLVEIGNDPDALYIYTGNMDGLEFKNRLTQPNS